MSYRPLVNLETGREAHSISSTLVGGFTYLEPTEREGHYRAPDGSIWLGCMDGTWRRETDEITARRTENFVREHIGRAEREATAILAEHNPVAPDKVHALVSLAWGRGFVAGFGAGHETFSAMLERFAGGEAK